VDAATARATLGLVIGTDVSAPIVGIGNLSQAQAEDAASTVFGAVSGQRLGQAVKGNLNATGSAPIYACRAWVNFNGTGTVVIRASGNVSSITDHGVGDYTVNFTTAMQDANYAIAGFANFGSNTAAAGLVTYGNLFAPVAGSVRIITANSASAATQDPQFVNVTIFR
jgi:hypothetical protein